MSSPEFPRALLGTPWNSEELWVLRPIAQLVDSF